jgi:hypothetical protein
MPLPGDGWPPLPDLAGASCRRPGVDPSWFFPNAGEPATRARKVCAGCPASGPCLDYALSCGGTLDGIWSGTSRLERKRLRRSVLARHPDDSDTGDVDVGPLVVAEPQATNGTMPELDAVGIAVCQGCGTPLTGQQQRWCSVACKKRTARHNGQPAAVTIAQDRRNGHRLGPDTLVSPGVSWQPLVRALLDCGAQVSFTVDSIHFVAIRSETR